HSFHQLTNPSSRNSIVCTSIQNAGGAPPFILVPTFKRSERSNVLTVRVSPLSAAFTKNTGGGGLCSSDLQDLQTFKTFRPSRPSRPLNVSAQTFPAGRSLRSA